jgi:two-component system alkaline phosphatase synthesis response regulator PhoP
MIYCLEDDNGIRDLIIYTLTVSGFSAKGFSEPKSFWKALSEDLPELILLDIMLPEEDGISILKKLRSNSFSANIPVIMTTAKGTEYDKVIGLDLGADDYLAKPFGMMEMVSRVKAVLRRAEPKTEDRLTVGEIQIDRMRHKVTVGGKEVVLTLKEYELLQLFAKNLGIVFTRDRLLQKIWGTDYIGETRTVDVHIGTLRTKLGKAGNLIETVRGVGYKMEESL